MAALCSSPRERLGEVFFGFNMTGWKPIDPWSKKEWNADLADMADISGFFI